MPSKFGWETGSERRARLKAEADAREQAYQASLRREQARLATEAAAKQVAKEKNVRPTREIAAKTHDLIMELLADFASCYELTASPAMSDIGDQVRWSLPLGEEQGTVYITAEPGGLVVRPSYDSAFANASAAEIAQALNRFTDYRVALQTGGGRVPETRNLPKPKA